MSRRSRVLLALVCLCSLPLARSQPLWWKMGADASAEERHALLAEVFKLIGPTVQETRANAERTLAK